MSLRHQSIMVSGFAALATSSSATAKAMGEFSGCNPLRISEPQQSHELNFEDLVFGDKILNT